MMTCGAHSVENRRFIFLTHLVEILVNRQGNLFKLQRDHRVISSFVKSVSIISTYVNTIPRIIASY